MNNTKKFNTYRKSLIRIAIAISLCLGMICESKTNIYADFGSVVPSEPFMEAYTDYTIKEGLAFDPEIFERQTGSYYIRSPHSAQWPALNYDKFVWDEDKLDIISFHTSYEVDRDHSYSVNIRDKKTLDALQERLNDTKMEFFNPIQVSDNSISTDIDICFGFTGMGRGKFADKYYGATVYLTLNDGNIYDNIIVGFKTEPIYKSYLIGKVEDPSVIVDIIDKFVTLDKYLIKPKVVEESEPDVPFLSFEGNVKKHIYSDWAYDDLYTAESYNIVPNELDEPGSNDLTKPITRREFCYILFEAMFRRGDIKEESNAKAFNDVNNVRINYATSIGVVNRDDKGNFEPDRYITREEAAKILYLCAVKLGAKEPATDMSNINYHDDKTFSNWARYYIKGVNYLDVMYGVGNNNFGPHENYSKEQAIITFVRLLNKYRADEMQKYINGE